ncbi:MAG: AAA family ATPase, partial [Verrucomicrobia bacterium]|nr:AAA family ATPase [Verrucomicrobiota bacterium]
MELNTVTPRIYVAATRQDDGKTTCCMGLYAPLGAKFSKIGYTKPVGQRFVEIAGKKVDEDSVLV